MNKVRNGFFIRMNMASSVCMCACMILILTILPQLLADGSDSNVLLYKSDTFSDEISERHSFVMFFAPWCGHCKHLGPIWDQLGEHFKDEDKLIKVAKVDCTVDTELCAQHDVTVYPTLKFFIAGKQEGVQYKGNREIDGFVSFVKGQLGISQEEPHSEMSSKKGVIELTDVSFSKYVDHGKHFVKFYAPWCGHCQRLAPTWEKLAKSFDDDASVTISKIDCVAYKSVCSKYNVDSYPTLMWFEEGRPHKKYDGERTHGQLKMYVEQLRLQENEDLDSNILTMPEDPPTPVVFLTTENFKQTISSGIAFVKFFAPWCGHCQKLAPSWEELARKLEGRDAVIIAKVDCTMAKCKRLCKQEGVDAYPTMMLYKSGKKVQEYLGSRDVDAMLSFIMDQMQHQEL